MDAVLTTPRLVLRPFVLADAPEFRRIKADPAVARMTSSFQTGYDLLSAQGFIEIAKARTALGHAYDWAITQDGRFIGSLGLFRTAGDWAIGYALSRSVWGQGFATESVQSAVKAFRRHYPNQALHAEVFTDNPGSRHVLLKSGFVQGSGTRSGYSLARLGAHPMWNFKNAAKEASQPHLQRVETSPLAAMADTA